MDRSRTPLVLFLLVAVYIVLQFGWWAWLLLSKDADILILQHQLLGAGLQPRLPMRDPAQDRAMVVGEGMVFLMVVLLGLVIIYRTVRHELHLARQQRDFLLAVSHELRTPIAGMKLHLDTLKRTGLDEAQRTGLSGLAAIEVERLRSLTEKILLATRLEDMRAPVDLHVTDVREELSRIVRTARSTYGKDHVITVTMPEALHIRTDVVAFRSVAENLIENACKYAPAGSTVHAELHDGNGLCELIVSDDGPGVAAQDRTRIFEKFFRSGSEETRGTKGTGLGLYIAQRLARSLGGRIEYRPRPAHGSIFAATFPHH